MPSPTRRPDSRRPSCGTSSLGSPRASPVGEDRSVAPPSGPDYLARLQRASPPGYPLRPCPAARHAPGSVEDNRMEKFDGVDYLEIDGLFSEEEIAVRDTIRQFVTDRVMPVIEKHNREGTFPAHLIPEMAELGVYGANIQGYGCPGL